MKLLLIVQCIPDRYSRVMDEVGFRIPRVGFRIPGIGFRIPKPWIPDSKGKKMLDSGIRIPLHGAKCCSVNLYLVIRSKANAMIATQRLFTARGSLL